MLFLRSISPLTWEGPTPVEREIGLRAVGLFVSLREMRDIGLPGLWRPAVGRFHQGSVSRLISTQI